MVPVSDSSAVGSVGSVAGGGFGAPSIDEGQAPFSSLVVHVAASNVDVGIETISSVSSGIASLLCPVLPCSPSSVPSAVSCVALATNAFEDAIEQVASVLDDTTIAARPGTVKFVDTVSPVENIEGASIGVSAPDPSGTDPSVPLVSSTVLASDQVVLPHKVQYLGNAGTAALSTAAVASGASSLGVPQVSSSLAGNSGVEDCHGGAVGGTAPFSTLAPNVISTVSTAATDATLNPTAAGTYPTAGNTVHTVPCISFQVLSQGGALGNSFRENVAPTLDLANFGNFGGFPENFSNFGGAPGNFATASNFGGVTGNPTPVMNNLTSLSSPYLPGQAPMSNVLGSTPMSRVQPSTSQGYVPSGEVPLSQVMPSTLGVQLPTSASSFVQPPSATSVHVQPTLAVNIQVNSCVPSPVPPAFLPSPFLAPAAVSMAAQSVLSLLPLMALPSLIQLLPLVLLLVVYQLLPLVFINNLLLPLVLLLVDLLRFSQTFRQTLLRYSKDIHIHYCKILHREIYLVFSLLC